MNYLDFESKVQIVSMLVEGCSLRSISRMTGHHVDTIGRVGYRIGLAASQLHDALVRNISPRYIQLDEIWSFVGKKQKNCAPEDIDQGDQYLYLAMDAETKTLITWHVGKRTQPSTDAFIRDLALRVISKPQITSDAFQSYESAIMKAFGEEQHYAQVIKNYAGYAPSPYQRRYSPTYITGVEPRIISGTPRKDKITTSHLERQNLNMRMGLRRFTRLTNGFSKRVERHAAAIALHILHHNLCRISEAHGLTPAMAQGLSTTVWSIEDLLLRLESDRPGVKACEHDWRALYTTHP